MGHETYHFLLSDLRLAVENIARYYAVLSQLVPTSLSIDRGPLHYSPAAAAPSRAESKQYTIIFFQKK